MCKITCCEPNDCEDKWLDWGDCDCNECKETGSQSRKKVMKVQASCGGKECQGIGETEKRGCTCDVPPNCKCQPKNCELAWDKWGPCKNGKMVRFMKVVKKAECDGECKGSEEEETK